MRRRDFVRTAAAGATLGCFPAGIDGVERERGAGGL